MKGNIEDTVIKKLSENNYFGEYSFFTMQPRTVSAKTTQSTILFCLSREKFIAAIKNVPEDYEKFC